MDGRGVHGEPVAIIGVACRFPGARDPAEFHELAVAGRRMFQTVRTLPGRSLRAATLDDWAVPPVTQGDWSSGGPAGTQADPGQADLGPTDLGPADLEAVRSWPLR
jgi:Beta-ketoacyl synthase, N-terminal domain